VTPLGAALVALLPVLVACAPRLALASDGPVIVALGDSLTAGWGVAPDEAFPARLAERLRREGYPHRMVNAGVSGDTSAGGLRRVEWVLRTKPEIVIVALGANDGLRGQSVAALRDNLEAIVRRLQAAGARVLLAGMRMPPNYGAAFTEDFAAAYPAVARRTGVPLVPFLLDGVAADPALNLPDGIHPNAAGHRIIADRLWPDLSALLSKGAATGPLDPPRSAAPRGPRGAPRRSAE
jgi:acyl-CoA thioesterase-1